MAGPTATKQQVEQILDDMARSANAKAEEIRRKHAAAAAAEIDAYFKQVIGQMQRTANQYGYESLATTGAYGSIGRGYNQTLESGKVSAFGKQRVRPLR